MIRNHALPAALVVTATACASLMGCGTKRTPSEDVATSRAPLAADAGKRAGLTAGPAKAIGSPCTPEEGWRPEPPSGPATAVDKAGRTMPLPRGPGPGPQSADELQPGVWYCESPGAVLQYPNGYWTKSCKGDSGCPAGSACDGVACRKICQSDSDCPASRIEVPVKCEFAGASGSSTGRRGRTCWYTAPVQDP
jgi:hypothetical protein